MTEQEKNIQIYRAMLHEVVNRCRDLDTLDLVYKLVVQSLPDLCIVSRLPRDNERSRAA